MVMTIGNVIALSSSVLSYYHHCVWALYWEMLYIKCVINLVQLCVREAQPSLRHQQHQSLTGRSSTHPQALRRRCPFDNDLSVFEEALQRHKNTWLEFGAESNVHKLVGRDWQKTMGCTYLFKLPSQNGINYYVENKTWHLKTKKCGLEVH